MAELRIDESQLNASVMPQVEAFATSFAQRAATVAKQIAPRRTGRLASSIRTGTTSRTGLWQVSTSIQADTPYARFVHEGTRPHVIRPRNARALRFEISGRVIFAARVNHPGTRARPFLRDAAALAAAADPRINTGT